jgi:hypothetical protein
MDYVNGKQRRISSIHGNANPLRNIDAVKDDSRKALNMSRKSS